MKTKIILLAISLIFNIVAIQAQVTRTINVSTPGTLSTLVVNDKTTITNLTLTGTINDADFATIKQMSALKNLDMGALSIVSRAIPNKAFEGKVMNGIILPEGLTSIGVEAFFGATIKRIVFPSTLTSLATGAFRGATIPSLDFSTCPNLQSMGQYVFQYIKLEDNKLDLSALTQVKFSGDGSYGTFSQCSADVILPDNKTTIEPYAFKAFWGSVKLPSKLLSIGEGAFKDSAIPHDIILPEGLTSIGVEAFFGATIKRIVFPSTLTSLATGAFRWTTVPSLDFSTCPNLQSMGKYVFQYIKLDDNKLDLSALTQVRFSGGNDYGTFSQCSADVILPDNKTSLEAYSFKAFWGSVKLPSKLLSIEEGVFKDSAIPHDIILPEGLTSIGVEAFHGATIKRIVFPSTLTYLATGVFRGATAPSLDFSTCPNLESMGQYVFQYIKLEDNKLDLSALRQVRFSEYRGYGTFSQCSADVILPDNKTTIEAYAFKNFWGSVVFSSVLEEIDSGAFYGAILSKGIILPASLKKIGDSAFENATIPSISFDKMGGQSGVSCF